MWWLAAAWAGPLSLPAGGKFAVVLDLDLDSSSASRPADLGGPPALRWEVSLDVVRPGPLGPEASWTQTLTRATIGDRSFTRQDAGAPGVAAFVASCFEPVEVRGGPSPVSEALADGCVLQHRQLTRDLVSLLPLGDPAVGSEWSQTGTLGDPRNKVSCRWSRRSDTAWHAELSAPAGTFGRTAGPLTGTVDLTVDSNGMLKQLQAAWTMDSIPSSIRVTATPR